MEISSNTLLFIGIASVCLGIIVGLFLFFYGRKNKKATLGIIGLVISIITGAIGPILPILVLLVFVFLIARKAPLDSASSEGAVDPAGNEEAGPIL
jgi:ABC-type amino acid transport system permease subunit